MGVLGLARRLDAQSQWDGPGSVPVGQGLCRPDFASDQLTDEPDFARRLEELSQWDSPKGVPVGRSPGTISMGPPTDNDCVLQDDARGKSKDARSCGVHLPDFEPINAPHVPPGALKLRLIQGSKLTLVVREHRAS